MFYKIRGNKIIHIIIVVVKYMHINCTIWFSKIKKKHAFTLSLTKCKCIFRLLQCIVQLQSNIADTYFAYAQ